MNAVADAAINAERPAVAAKMWTVVPAWDAATDARPARLPCSALCVTT